MWRVTSAIVKQAERMEEAVKGGGNSKGEGRGWRVNQEWKMWGIGWEDGLSNERLVENWIYMNMARELLMILAGTFGGLVLWALPVGKRELGWWARNGINVLSSHVRHKSEAWI
jgi:hypothetical protein